jgi:hypothetical protein
VNDIDFAELERYVQYLQRQLVTPGSEAWSAHERVREWVTANRASLRGLLPSGSTADEITDEYVRFVTEFEHSGPYDSASASAIFAPLMGRIIAANRTTGLRTVRPIRLVDSPAIEATPFSRSTDGVHIIFAGHGTFSFCNYWAKLFVSLGEAQARGKERSFSSLTIEAIRNASKLALYYAHTGTVLGFGILESPHRLLPLRVAYLQAMELFCLGHEVGHCIADDDADHRYRGLLSDDDHRELELLCDRIGTCSSRIACSDDNWAGFCGAGAALMIYAHEICRNAQSRSASKSEATPHRHPPLAERIRAVREQVVSTSPADQVAAVSAYLDDVLALCDQLATLVNQVFDKIGFQGFNMTVD